MDEKKFRQGQKVRVSYEAEYEYPDGGNECAWVKQGNGWTGRVPVSGIEPIDDPASDPIGTVREKHGQSFVKLGGRAAFKSPVLVDYVWVSTYDGDSYGHLGMVGCPISGAVPGTPAWEVYVSGE